MKLSTKEDVEAPIATVFGMLSDFEMFERSAIRRGAEVHRVGEHEAPEVGLAWEASFSMRGKERSARVELTQYTPPSDMVFESRSSGLITLLEIELMPLSPRRTRVAVSAQFKPSTLPARLFVQSMKLAKSNLSKRFKLRVADYAKDIEDRASRIA
ncbi:SRPBCC family protein [Aestuariivita sp.]|jgi:carbon monoxide dehydrogenase subunit G|uniref:SRPBCC family protein n=1 Tax=Aestuariivita sp. TaxID=1872407 RepID=UPI00216BFF4A|nr:SRPBCC family protein [Aestuariivita sp.]MCE8006051.1 SRPBCC family protein [Aestuariivita sp.]